MFICVLSRDEYGLQWIMFNILLPSFSCLEFADRPRLLGEQT